MLLYCSMFVLIVPCLFLFQESSKVEKLDGSEIIHLKNGLNITVNGDTWDYIQPAMNYNHLWWDPYHIKQSRPLHIITVHYLGNFLIYFGFPTSVAHLIDDEIVFKNDYWSKRKIQILSSQWHYFISYIVVNYIVLTISLFFLLKSIMHHQVKKTPTYKYFLFLILPAIFVVFNYVVKSFYFNTHSQMFAILSASVLVYTSTKYTHDFYNYEKIFILLCLILGVLLLFYGSFIYVLPFLLVIEAFKSKIDKNFVKRWLLGSLLFVTPYIVYITYLKVIQNVNYYNMEAQNSRQFVWVIDSIEKGDLVKSIITKWKIFLTSFDFINIIFIVPLFLFSVLRYNSELLFKKINIYVFMALYILLFSFLNGYYKPRMTFMYTLPLMVMIYGNILKKYKLNGRYLLFSLYLINSLYVVYMWAY